jgi:uncharacterized membrane protein
MKKPFHFLSVRGLLLLVAVLAIWGVVVKLFLMAIGAHA